jgi:hypothetical protein
VAVSGDIDLLGMPDGALSLDLTSGGTTHRVPTRLERLPDTTKFSATIDVRTAAGGRALADGTYEVRSRLSIGGLETTSPLSDPDGLSTVRWWRGLRPMHAKTLADKETLTLLVRPVDMAHAVRRRLGR